MASSNRLSNPKKIAQSVQYTATDRYQSNVNDAHYKAKILSQMQVSSPVKLMSTTFECKNPLY